MREYSNIVQFVFRWVIVSILIYTGISKFNTTVILSNSTSLYSIFLAVFSIFEIVIAGALAILPKNRYVNYILILVFSVFAIISFRFIGSQYVIDCGCGLPSFLSPTSPLLVIARDLLLLIMVIVHYRIVKNYPTDTSNSMKIRILGYTLIIQLVFVIYIVFDNFSYIHEDMLLKNHTIPIEISSQMLRHIYINVSPTLTYHERFVLLYITPSCPTCQNKCPEFRKLIRIADGSNVPTILAGPGKLQHLKAFADLCKFDTYIFTDSDLTLAKYLGISEAPLIALVVDGNVLVAAEYQSVLAILNTNTDQEQP